MQPPVGSRARRALMGALVVILTTCRATVNCDSLEEAQSARRALVGRASWTKGKWIKARPVVCFTSEHLEGTR